MTTYSTTNAPLPWQEPYLQDYMARAQEVANQPYQQSPGTYVAPNQMLQTSWQAALQRAMQGNPAMNAATNTLTNTLNGQYLGANNPYLSDQVNAAQGDLVRNWNQVQAPQFDAAMQRSGSFGNTGVQQTAGFAGDALQRNLANISTTMRGNAYANERQLQNSALNMAPQYAQQDYQDINALMGVGNAAQGFNQAAANQNQQWWQEAQNYPQSKLAAYGTALGQIGGGTQTQTQPDPSMWSQLFGGALAGTALYNYLYPKPGP
jgi:hypothetical protein